MHRRHVSLDVEPLCVADQQLAQDSAFLLICECSTLITGDAYHVFSTVTYELTYGAYYL